MNKKQIFPKTRLALLILTIGIFLPLNHNHFIQAKKDNKVFIEVESNVQEDKWVEKDCEVTMYTLDECGKSSKHRFYGITASGTKVFEGRTIAASPEIPFEAEIKISGFEDVFVVEDRGGMIKTHRGRWPGSPKIDIYTENKTLALEWGRQKVKCKILQK